MMTESRAALARRSLTTKCHERTFWGKTLYNTFKVMVTNYVYLKTHESIYLNLVNFSINYFLISSTVGL